MGWGTLYNRLARLGDRLVRLGDIAGVYSFISIVTSFDAMQTFFTQTTFVTTFVLAVNPKLLVLLW